jgi:ABC-type lipoprotein release transport system permease subunit
MWLALAWRNIWRNRRRTLITLAALTLGTTAIVSIHSYRESTFAQLLQDITTGLVGHIQVHGNGWQKNPELATVVRDPEAVEARLMGALPDARAERRVLGYGLAGSGDASAAALVLGVEPSRSRNGARMITIEKGRDLDDAPAREAVLGSELAVQLGVAPGAELVLVGQAADGSTANDRYTVVGTGDAGTGEMNATAVFLHLKDAQEFFGLGDAVHSIMVRLPTDDEDLTRPLSALRAALDLKTLEALSWSEMLPELKGMIAEKRRGGRAIDVVVFLIVALGVLNAMTMSTFERTREFGVMASVGTRPRQIVGLVLLESLLQGALGLFAGIAISVTVLLGLGSLDIAAFAGGDMLGIRMPSHIELHLKSEALRSAVGTVLVTMLLGGLWPAFRAARLKPVEAARHV